MQLMIIYLSYLKLKINCSISVKLNCSELLLFIIMSMLILGMGTLIYREFLGNLLQLMFSLFRTVCQNKEKDVNFKTIAGKSLL